MSIYEENKLRKYILSGENIFDAIYSLESYVNERNLLTEKDLNLYYKLKDKHNKKKICQVIRECRKELERIIDNENELFDINVFFKIKKWNKEEEKTTCRPIHTASLITQICLVCLLNVIMYKENRDEKELSELAQLIPSNFYGNIPSTTPERIFCDWRVKYKEYTEKVIARYNNAKENNSYKYEVSLDLENFFPSIDLDWMLNFIFIKIKHLYSESEQKTLNIIIKKLLHFNIINIKNEEEKKMYYGKNYNTGDRLENVGIPQGLPQSYFLGNLCMTEVSKKFNEMFPGESFYYVDDSVIYTNSKNADPNNFPKALEKLNENLEQIFEKTANDIYKLNVHKDGKSMTAEIDNKSNIDKAWLALIAKDASGIGKDIYDTLDTLEDTVLEEKLKNLKSAITTEIKNVKKYIKENSVETNKDNNNIKFMEIYLKSLNRYKKFFGYRQHLMKYRINKDIKSIEEEFYKNYINKIKNDSSKKNIEEILANMDEENFLAEMQLILSSKITKEERKKFKKDIENFESKLTNGILKATLYFYNNIKDTKDNGNIYESLQKKAEEKISNQNKSDMKEIIKKLNNMISSNTHEEDEFVNLLDYGSSYNQENYDKKICKISNEYKRRIYNACISRLFNVELGDDCRIHKMDYRPITYYELRIFAFIRNRNCNITKFSLPEFSSMDTKIDYSIYEVINIFIKHVMDTEYIDKLIVIHKYVSSVWKNGSRFLYFYTLHNQEHSIELIKRTVSLCKLIDYIQVKKDDYYILFLACYLHDISMVLQHNIDSFMAKSDITDFYGTAMYEKLKKLNVEKNLNLQTTKEIMKESFEKVANYFETISRGNHTSDSANYIRKNNDLEFLPKTLREMVARISEAHGYDTKDVYGLKSQAKVEVLSEKYQMILLRIADLLDGNKDRVSLNILRNNIENMPKESKFHWVTHAIIDKYEVYTKYEFKDSQKEKKEFTSVLNNGSLEETFIVKIKINECNLTFAKENETNKYCITLDNENKKIIFDFSKENKGDGYIPFICEWIMIKNQYLIDELYALQRYLKRNKNNLFDTKICMEIDFSEAKSLTAEYRDIVLDKFEEYDKKSE